MTQDDAERAALQRSDAACAQLSRIAAETDSLRETRNLHASAVVRIEARRFKQCLVEPYELAPPGFVYLYTRGASGEARLQLTDEAAAVAAGLTIVEVRD